jgi:hypothetical protein
MFPTAHLWMPDYLQSGTRSLDASADAYKRILDENASNPLASV